MYIWQIGLVSIYYLYGIPSIIMLILTLIILIFKNQKELTTSYFRLQILLLSIDLLSYLNSNLTNRLPNQGVFVELFENLKNTEFDIRFINFFAYYLVYARYLGVLFESTNRLSAITLSFSHEKIWILLLPISVTATIFLPFVFAFEFLCNKTIYRYLFDTPELGFNITARENNCKWVSKELIATILSFGTSLVSAILNLISLGYLIRHKGFFALFKCNSSNNQSESIAKSNKKDKAERNLLYCTVISLLLGVIWGLSSNLQLYFSTNGLWTEFRVSTMCFSILYDLTCLSKIWMLFAFSATIRKNLIHLIVHRQFIDNNKTIINVTPMLDIKNI